MRKIEILLLSFSCLGFLMFILNYPFGSIILILSLLSLSSIYFFLGFWLFHHHRFGLIFNKKSSFAKVIGRIATGIGISIVILGIMFKLFRWPFANQNLMIGLCFCTLIMILSLIMFIAKKDIFYKTIAIRTVFYVLIGLLLLLLPSYTFIKIKYRDYPKYIEVVKKLEADPNNILLQQEEEKEYNKMKSRQ
ncbi:GldL-related protein [Aquimarina algicola]|uniref:GldL-related protein n=1 Tax=Aquimarina algicola TaxID=2589995 RepID=UPI001CF4E69E|nr:hypothetical protein [Aquimarina algicola]